MAILEKMVAQYITSDNQIFYDLKSAQLYEAKCELRAVLRDYETDLGNGYPADETFEYSILGKAEKILLVLQKYVELKKTK